MTTQPESSVAWRRPASVAEAARLASKGATLVGGAAALGSAAFPHGYGSVAVDLEGLALDVLAPPRLGAMVRLERLVAEDAISTGWPVVAEAAGATATPEVRRMATVGGTVAAGLPTSDLCLALCAAEASVRVLDGSGAQTVSVSAYLAQPLPGVIVEVVLGEPRPGAYRRFANRPGFAPAVAAVAGVVHGGVVALWAGAVADRPVRLSPGALPAVETLRDDAQASGWYRRRLLSTLIEDVTAALEVDAPRRER